MKEFFSFLNQSVSPAHAVKTARDYLARHGFEELSASGEWSLKVGGKYCVPFFDTSLIAFTVSKNFSFRLAASHTDWPCLRIKPDPELVSGGCAKLNIEPYGGAIYSTWLDRPLGVAGLVSLRTNDPLKPETKCFSFDKPVLTIPNLAIHMNREVNKGVALKANVDLLPLCRTIKDQWEKDGYFVKKLAEAMSVSPEDILSYDLCVYNTDPAQLLGMEDDFVSAPRLDNITSVYACLKGLVSAKGKGINVAVLYDNEEVGSNTKQGADSAMLTTVLEKISVCLGKSRTEYLNALMEGVLLSCDVAHAAHPNHMELSDPTCQPYLGRGVVLKLNFNQSYPTDAAGTAIVEGLCRAKKIPYQKFMNRADLRGGSTIGAMASARMTMRTIDVGVPMLAMHSARETMAACDEKAICDLAKAFFEA